MELLNGFGTEIVLALQEFLGSLIPLMRFFTFLGTEEFYLLVMPILFWSINTSMGFQVGVLLMISSSLNFVLKVALHTPRPFWVDPQIMVYSIETTFGIPSGHAQNAVALWGLAATFVRKTWFWVLAISMMFLIGLSRIVLGLHFPLDVLAGWAIGGILLYLFISLRGPVAAWYRQKERGMQIIITLGLTLAILLVGTGVTLFVSQTIEIPLTWFANASLAAPDEPADPFALDSLLTATGTLFGLVAGYIMLQSQGGYEPRGTAIQHLLRYVLGVVGILILWYGLGEVFPRQANLLGFGLRFFRYALVGAWAAWWAPRLFIRLKLAHRVEQVEP